MQVETEIQELNIENEELRYENKDRNDLKILSDKLENLNANQSEEITEKVSEIQKQTKLCINMASEIELKNTYLKKQKM